MYSLRRSFGRPGDLRTELLVIDKVIYCVLPFADVSEAALERAANLVRPLASKPRRINHEGRRKAHYAGRAAVGMMARQLGLPVWVVADPEYGYLKLKPQAGQFACPYVNISHTDGVAVAALSPRPIGIDVERLDRDTEMVLERAAVPEELSEAGASVTVDGESVPAGIALWSGKEAFSKALGLGLKFGLTAFRLHLSGSPPFRAATPQKGIFEVQTPAVQYQRWNEYLLSFCTEREVLSRGLMRFAGDTP